MKKILTVSLVAIMAVSAARADIASVQYVDETVSATKTTIEQGVEAKNYATQGYVGTQIEGATNSITTAYGNADTALKNELQGSIDLKQDKLDDDNFKVDPTASGGNVISEISVADGVVTYKTASVATTEGLQNLTNTVGEHTTAIAGLEAKDAELAEDIAEKAAASEVTELTGRVGANETAITALQGADAAFGTRLTTAEGEIAAINNETTGIAAVAAGNLAAAKSELEGKINAKANADEVTGIDTRVSANENAISAINNETTGIAAVAAGNLAAAKSELEGKINAKANADEVTGIDTRLTTAESDIDALQTGIADVYTKAQSDAEFINAEELATGIAGKADTTYVNEELGKKQNSLPTKPTYCDGKECALVMDKTSGDLTWRVVVYQESDKTTTASN